MIHSIFLIQRILIHFPQWKVAIVWGVIKWCTVLPYDRINAQQFLWKTESVWKWLFIQTSQTLSSHILGKQFLADSVSATDPQCLRALRDPPRLVYRKPPSNGCVGNYTTWGKLLVSTHSSNLSSNAQFSVSLKNHLSSQFMLYLTLKSTLWFNARTDMSGV